MKNQLMIIAAFVALAGNTRAAEVGGTVVATEQAGPVSHAKPEKQSSERESRIAASKAGAGAFWAKEKKNSSLYRLLGEGSKQPSKGSK